MQTIPLPALNEGETYVTTLFDATTQTGYHLILLPGDNNGATWQKQLEWAKEIGGDLPTRVEQALLFEKHRDQFKKDLYWSNEAVSYWASWAWYQYFYNGGQNNNSQTLELRARAVRRLIIE